MSSNTPTQDLIVRPNGMSEAMPTGEAVPAGAAVTIYSLPNEILQKTFSLLSGRNTWIDLDHTEWNFSECSDETIKNVRLTCHLFRANATYLVDQIRVDLSANSLLRFETMCSHMDFQKGVKAVEICLAQYDSRLANSFEEFVSYHIRMLEQYRPESSEAMSKVVAVLAAWRKYRYYSAHISELPRFSDEEFDFVRTLVDGHRQYRRNFREQQALASPGVFAARVAAAMAQLPNTRHLEFTDWETIRWGDRFSNRLPHLDVSSKQALCHSLASWRIHFNEVRGDDLIHIIPDVLSELSPAGKEITSLNIQLSPSARDDSYPALITTVPWQLRRGLRNLRAFRFEVHPATSGFPVLKSPDSRALAQFFDQCLNSRTLESIIVDVGHWSDETTSVINGRFWPRLRYLELKHLATTEAELDTLTSLFLPSSSRREFPVLVLHRVYLISGTWDSAFRTIDARDIILSLGTPRGRRGAQHARLRLGERVLAQELWRV